jgi:hypothetical protein
MIDEWSEQEAKAKAATPGPWIADHLECYVFTQDKDGACGDMVAEMRGFGAGLSLEENCSFIAAANPETVLKLIAALRERDAEIERLKRQIENMNANMVDAVTWANTYDQLRIAREALEFITTGPERHDDTFEAHKSNRDRLRAAVLRARAALEKIGQSHDRRME